MVIRNVKVDGAVIGAGSLDEDGSIMDYDSREVAVSRFIVANARQAVLVCDRSKLEIGPPVPICDASEIGIRVIDRLPRQPFAEACARTGVAVEAAGETAQRTFGAADR